MFHADRHKRNQCNSASVNAKIILKTDSTPNFCFLYLNVAYLNLQLHFTNASGVKKRKLLQFSDKLETLILKLFFFR